MDERPGICRGEPKLQERLINSIQNKIKNITTMYSIYPKQYLFCIHRDKTWKNAELIYIWSCLRNIIYTDILIKNKIYNGLIDIHT